MAGVKCVEDLPQVIRILEEEMKIAVLKQLVHKKVGKEEVTESFLLSIRILTNTSIKIVSEDLVHKN